MGEAGPEHGVLRVLDDQQAGTVQTRACAVQAGQEEALGRRGEAELPGGALDAGREVAVQQLPLIIREQIRGGGHLRQEELGLDAVESHGLVDHVATLPGRVDASQVICNLGSKSIFKLSKCKKNFILYAAHLV